MYAVEQEFGDSLSDAAFLEVASLLAQPGRVEVNLANSGLSTAPIKGEIIGPLQGVRSTTVPWMYRHLFGDQINGAPEPLVYTPIYKFKPNSVGDLPAPTTADMFKGSPRMSFKTGSGKVEVMPLNVPSLQSPVVSPTTFQTMAPQPPPFVPPVPPDPGNHPEVTISNAPEPTSD